MTRWRPNPTATLSVAAKLPGLNYRRGVKVAEILLLVTPWYSTGRTCRCDCHQKGVDDHCAVWLRLSFSVLGQGHLASGDHNQTGHRQNSTGDEHTKPEKAERHRRLHR